MELSTGTSILHERKYYDLVLKETLVPAALNHTYCHTVTTSRLSIAMTAAARCLSVLTSIVDGFY
jgi:hypothetical protein